METDLTALFLGAAGFAVHFGGRIHWGVQPDHAKGFPYINLATVSQPYANELDGAPRARGARVQIDVWGETRLEALDARDLVLAFLKTGPKRGVIKGLRPMSARPLMGSVKPVRSGYAIDIWVRGEWA